MSEKLIAFPDAESLKYNCPSRIFNHPLCQPDVNQSTQTRKILARYSRYPHHKIRGTCFTDWEENIYSGDEFRLEIELPNKNRLPLSCKAVYRFEDTGIGVKFLNISQFEQELISKIIAHRMEVEGVPLSVSPFEEPSTFVKEPTLVTPRGQREAMLTEAMSSD